MTPWTGKAGSPTPEILRHDLVPCGERQRRCTRCEGYWWLDELPREDALCRVAVAQRLAELEAHEASIHKAAARARRGVVRWLRAAADDALALAPPGRRKSGLRNHAATITAVADDIDSGAYAEWCEANPEIPPAPVGADAGRDPGSKDSR